MPEETMAEADMPTLPCLATRPGVPMTRTRAAPASPELRVRWPRPRLARSQQPARARSWASRTPGSSAPSSTRRPVGKTGARARRPGTSERLSEPWTARRWTRCTPTSSLSNGLLRHGVDDLLGSRWIMECFPGQGELEDSGRNRDLPWSEATAVAASAPAAGAEAQAGATCARRCP